MKNDNPPPSLFWRLTRLVGQLLLLIAVITSCDENIPTENLPLSENFVSVAKIELLLKEASRTNARRSNRVRENLFDRNVQKIGSTCF